MQYITYQEHQLIQVWDQVFTPVECQAFIDLSHGQCYETATIINRNQSEVRLDVRNNQRVIYDDVRLAQSLFE